MHNYKLPQNTIFNRTQKKRIPCNIFLPPRITKDDLASCELLRSVTDVNQMYYFVYQYVIKINKDIHI